MNKRFEICPPSDLEPGERRIVDLDGVSVGVFNVDGEYCALKNDCPHHRAPLCEGEITGTTTADGAGDTSWTKDGEIIRCPWHGWEFEIATGESVFDPHAVRARSFETAVESGCQCSAAKTSEADEGAEPPVETYEVAVEDETVVVYL